MKGAISFAMLIMCSITVFPIIFMLFEHMINGRDSLLQQLLDNL